MLQLIWAINYQFLRGINASIWNNASFVSRKDNYDTIINIVARTYATIVIFNSKAFAYELWVGPKLQLK